MEPTDDPTGTASYEIRINGELGQHWRAWFGGMTVERPGDGTTVLTGSVPDQAALHGVLQRIRDLGLPLVSVERIAPRTTRPHPDPSRPDERGPRP